MRRSKWPKTVVNFFIRTKILTKNIISRVLGLKKTVKLELYWARQCLLWTHSTREITLMVGKILRLLRNLRILRHSWFFSTDLAPSLRPSSEQQTFIINSQLLDTDPPPFSLLAKTPSQSSIYYIKTSILFESQKLEKWQNGRFLSFLCLVSATCNQNNFRVYKQLNAQKASGSRSTKPQNPPFVTLSSL